MAALFAAVPAIISGVSSAVGTVGSAIGGATGLTASSALGLLGTGVSIAGGLASASAQKSAAYAEAEQHKREGTRDFARSVQRANDERRRARDVAAKAKARAADSGGGMPGTLGTIAEVLGEGEHHSNLRLWNGKIARAGASDRASAAISRGKNQYKGTLFDTVGEGAYGIKKAFYS